MEKQSRESEVGNERWWKHFRVTVEPSLFLYMMAFMVTTVVENVYYNYKSCTANHNFTHEICIELEKHDDVKKLVQKTTSNFLQNNNIAGHIIPIILALFMGSFSDRRGR
jgi:PCFT/HCP family folate transporter-like MFS transporter 1/3